MKEYNFKKIEKKWQEFWNENKTFKVDENVKQKKCYVLDMFPYPSGSGLHVGHPKGYVATDVYARYKILNGYNVLHPMGFDSFGLPAENYAIKHKINPKIAVSKNINRYKKQLKMFGFTYDWNRQIITSDPEYYKWTQWIFLQMFKKGLAYESYEPINWCPSCKTGLANEDLQDGKCERCGSVIEKKPMRQWVLKMTEYAERLLDDLKLVNWENQIIEQQINWIGKSNGSEIEFKIHNSKEKIKVFTTRADTLFGATYMAIAPEHKLIDKLAEKIKNIDLVKKYINKAIKKSDLERTELNKDKSGIKLEGLYAINPANKEKLPIYVSDYVLITYGTGAIMAVPAHDERDYEFAKKYNIKIIKVIDNNKDDKIPFCDEGRLINSAQFDGQITSNAKLEITKFVNGKTTINYKMRDWVFSRQRYWGEPIPIVHCKKCGSVGVNEKDLPVKLPKVKKYEPTGTGESPLANIKDWVNTKCPKCGGNAKRETNTMPQWAGSSWYYLRYIDPKNLNKIVELKKEEYWMNPKGVDLYVGGAEHATRHLLYARFWHKFLYDIGIVTTLEPFYRLQHVGLINGDDGRKMSKRWGNVINPDVVIEKFGADAFRIYEMFMGPFYSTVNWNNKGVKGTKRFLDKIWKISLKLLQNNFEKDITSNNIRNQLSKTIIKVGNDIESFNFNTAISSMMIFINALNNDLQISKNDYLKFIKILSPFAPHVCEEIHSLIQMNNVSIFKSKWPRINQNANENERIKIAIMVNGKKRGLIVLKASQIDNKNEIIELSKKENNVRKYLVDKKIKKEIYIPGKIVSFVV